MTSQVGQKVKMVLTQKGKAVLVGLLALSGIGYAGYEKFAPHAAPMPAELKEALGEKAPRDVGPEEAAKLAGKTDEVVRVRFVVASAGKTRNGGLTFLNSQPYVRGQQSKGLTVVVQNWNVPGYDSPRSLEKKTVTAVGKVTEFRGSPQIVVDKPAQVVVK